LYFAFGRFAAQTRNKLFDSPILAMPHGPMVKEVHEAYAGQREIVADDLEDLAFDDFK
jgi:uncharacterized phage-associated protein